MRKIKKSLAVLLAVLMLASFMPLFASAEAITINRNNVKIVPPSVSPSVIEYGQTLADITVTGGECWYVDPDTGVETLVPGHFEVRSTTTKPAVNDAYNVQLKFVSDDTTQYSNISLLTATTVTIKSGTWPTLKVNGLDGVLVEAPTATDILTGQKLREATLTGGVVNDKDGNALTGTWSFVDTNFYPTASGKYEVQFKATGYNTLKTTVDVKVTSNGNATISETPAVQYYLAVNDYLVDATFTGGKVVDENGTEITTGNWIFPDIENQKSSEIVFDKEGTFTYKAQWSALGYPILFADVTVTVVAAYTVDKPKLTSPVYYVDTKGELPFVYGNATIPGTYTIADADTKVSTNKNTTQSAKVTFTPDDKNYKPITWSYSFKVKENDIWYTPTDEELTIFVPYGYSNNSVSYLYSTGKLSNGTLNWPDWFMEQQVERFSWTAKNYDIKSMEIGEKILVNGYVYIEDSATGYYSSLPEDIYIQIASSTYEGDLGSFSITVIDNVTQECAIKFSCSIPGITGTVTINQGDTVLGTYTPDINGKIRETIYFTPEKDGKYAFTATYTPADTDKVTVENPVFTSKEVELDIKTQIKIFIYDNELALYKEEKGTCGASKLATFVIAPGNGHTEADIEGWEAYDQNGNKVQLYREDGTPVSDAQSITIGFVVPEEDSGITELHLYPIGPWSPDDSFASTPQDDDSIIDRLLAFWHKLINYITELYSYIMDIFVPTFEEVF